MVPGCADMEDTMSPIMLAWLRSLIAKHDIRPFYRTRTWKRLRKEILSKDRYECQKMGNADLIYSMMDVLTDEYQIKIIKAYYICGYTMAEAAEHIPFHVRRCWQIRADALRTIAQRLHTIAH